MFRPEPSLEGQPQLNQNPESKSNEEATRKESSKKLKGGLAAGELNGASLSIYLNQILEVLESVRGERDEAVKGGGGEG